jgi:hypothetical protein
MRRRPSFSLSSLVLASCLLVLGCGSSITRPDSGRSRPDGGNIEGLDAYETPTASCVSGGECAEYHDYSTEELATFEGVCMGTWAIERCDPDTVVGGCRTDDPDGTGFYIQWFLSPGTTESGARDLCELAMREFVPAP